MTTIEIFSWKKVCIPFLFLYENFVLIRHHILKYIGAAKMCVGQAPHCTHQLSVLQSVETYQKIVLIIHWWLLACYNEREL